MRERERDRRDNKGINNGIIALKCLERYIALFFSTRQTHGLEQVRSPHRRREDGVWLGDLAGPAEPDSMDTRTEACL